MNQQAAAPNDHEEQRKKTGGNRRSATNRGLKKSPGSASRVRKKVSQIDRRPRIIISGQVLLPNRAQAKVMANRGGWFQFGDRIVGADESPEKVLRFGPVTSDHLRHLFPNLTVWAYRTASGKRQRRLVDFERVKHVEVRGVWPGVAPLIGVSASPFLTPSGRVGGVKVPRECLSAYDPEAQVYYVATFPVPNILEKPRKQALAALARMRKLTRGRVEFLTAADESAWLAALLTPHARFAYRHCSPVFVFDDHVPGKVLANVLSNVCIYRPMFVMNPSNSAEWRQAIMAVGNARLPTALIANIDDPSALDCLNAVLTATEWTDYLPQQTGQVTVPLRTVWCAQGRLSGLPVSMARRCLPIQLQEGGRARFHRRALLNERLQLIMDALTIMRAYVVARRPDMGLPAFPPFAGWSRVVRDPLVWLGLPDPVSARND